jgi:TniQ
MSSSNEWVIPQNFEPENFEPLWTQCPQPQQDEGFTSWFTRIAKANCADTNGLFQHLMGKTKGTLRQLDSRPKLKNALISQLEPFIDTDPKALKDMSFHYFQKNPLRSDWDVLIKVQPSPNFCPKCLKTDTVPYFRDQWQLPFVTACTHHQTLLMNTCPHCYSPIRHWESPWNKSITTCSNCHQDITDGKMFLRKIQGDDGIKFQNQLLEVYRTAEYQGEPIHVRNFFQKIWKLATAESIDKNNCTLSLERIHKALLLAFKALQIDSNKIYNRAVWAEIDTYPIMLRKIFEDLKTATNYSQNKGRFHLFIKQHQLPNKFLRSFSNILFERGDLQKAFTTAGGLKGDFGLAWAMFQARRYYQENHHPPPAKDHPFCSIVYCCEIGAFKKSGITDWISFLQKALGKRLTYRAINKNFKSKEGFERACVYITNFRVKNNRIPSANEPGLRMIIKAVRRGTWAEFGIKTWHDLLFHVFRSEYRSYHNWEGIEGLTNARELMKSYYKRTGNLPMSKFDGHHGIQGILRRRLWKCFGIESWVDLLIDVFGEAAATNKR